MYASIPDALRALARKIGADANGRNEEEILNNIVVKLGGTPIRNHGVAGSIDAMTKVVDLDVMHNLTTLNVTPTSEAQTITPESPVDGYSSVSVSAVTSAIDQNIVAGNIKKDVQILGVTGSYEGSGGGYNAKISSITGATLYADSMISSLEQWEVPYGWNDIGTEGFTGCSELTYIKIPSSVTLIGSYAFMGCSKLTTVILENGLTTIDDEAFANTGLVNITIPSSVTSIGTDAFDGCTDLTTITIHKAEGSITGAPWGAPNATVVWDG